MTAARNPEQLTIAEKGHEKAREVAQETMQLVRKAMGCIKIKLQAFPPEQI